jgi:hypothetical protein
MALADLVLETLLIILAEQPTNVHVVGDRNVLAANAAVIVPLIHAAGSQARHDEMVEHVAVGHGPGGVLQAICEHWFRLLLMNGRTYIRQQCYLPLLESPQIPYR